MSCSVNRDQKGVITRVNKQDGTESKLFQQIASHALVTDTETALQIYKNKFTNKLKDVDESNMELTHKVGDEMFSSFKNALTSAQENTPISVGILANDKFTELVGIPKNTDLSNEIGFVQNSILNGNIAESRIKVGNKYLLQAEGKSETRKQASLSILREQSSFHLGSKSMTVDGTAFALNKTLGITILYTKNGEKVEMENSDFAKMSDQEIMSKFDSGIELIAEREFSRNFPVKRDAPLPTNAPVIKEDSELVRNLTKLLKNMNISVVGMTNYITNYTLRHGVNPGAEAFADIANQVIGIVAGKETTENLLEETVHFIVEALPQERVENVLRNINKSEEYKQHYQIQKAIYESEYSGEELENVVRREILGKIITNAILQTEEKSEVQQNFFENAKRLISEFFQDIVNYFKPEYQVELDNLLEDVRNLIDSQDVGELELSNFQGSERRFYNATTKDPIAVEALKSVNTLLKLERDLNKTGKGNSLNLKELRQVQKELESAYELHSIAKVNEIVSNTVKILESALKDSVDNNKSFDLSQEENVAYENLTTDVRKGQGLIKELLASKDLVTNVEKQLIKSIENTIIKIEDLQARRTLTYNDRVVKMFRAVTTDRGLSEKEFDLMMAWHDRAKNDVNYFNKTFGTLSNSSDSLANIYAILRTSMINRHTQQNFQDLKELQYGLRQQNADEKTVSKLVKNGYFENERDMAKYYKDMENNFIEAYKKHLPATTLKNDEIIKMRANQTLPFEDKQEEIQSDEYEANKLISEDRMVASYYSELEDKYNALNTSDYTKDTLRALNSQKNRVKAKAINKDKQVDLSKLSLQDLKALEILDQSRRKMKSPITEDGSIKDGLAFDNEQKLILTQPLEDLSNESRIAYDIYLLDKYNSDKLNARIDELQKATNRTALEDKELLKLTTFNRPQAFDDLILSKATQDEQIATLKLNSNITFSREFWDKVASTANLESRLKSIKTDLNEDRVDEIIYQIKELSSKKTALIKTHVKTNNPAETDVENMSDITRESLKSIEEELEALRDEARVLTKDVKVEINDDFQGVSQANDAWNNALSDLGITSGIFDLEDVSVILEFAQKNATTRNANAIKDAESNVRRFVEGKTTSVSKSVENSLLKQGLTKENLKDATKRILFLKTFAEDRLLSYYRRFTPASYSEFKEDLDEMNASDILSKNYEYIEITPNYSFNEQDDSRLNPDYIANSKMGVFQPKKSIYENKEFTAKFGKIVRDDKGYLVSAEKDSKEFQVYKLIMNFRFSQIDKMDGGTSYNAYITPQSRKQTIERVFGKKKSFAENWKEFSTFTDDEQAQGDNSFGASNRIIPKQFMNSIEDKNDVSDDIFYGLILTNNASNLYKARVDAYADFMAIRDVAKSRITDGVKVETTATNRFKTLDSATDNDLYGIREVTTDTIFGQNTGKIVDNLGWFLRLKGLGASLIIPTTAYLTGKTKQTVERMLGEYYNKDSYNRGAKEYDKQFKSATGEIGKVYTKSEMITKGEYWQAFDAMERIYGSGFSSLKRLSPKMAMILYQCANFPIYGKNMYNVLHDFRVVDGKVVKFTDFYRSERNKDYNVTKKQVQEKWALENDVINNFHSTNEKGQIVWDKAKLQPLLKDLDGNLYSDEAFDKHLLSIVDDIRFQIKNLNIRSDMQLSPEDKIAAQRHYMWRFLLAFKGYLVVLAEERFKSTEFNPQSRQMEGGSYYGLYELGRDAINDARRNGGGFIEALKKQYDGDFTEQKAQIDSLKNLGSRTQEQELELKTLTEQLTRDIELSDLRHSHVKRLGIDLLVLQGLIGIMMLLRGYADEPDQKNNYPLQMAALLAQRLSGEVNSANINIASNYYQVLSAPLQGFKMITDISKLPKAYRDGELIYTVGKGWMPFVSSMEQMMNPAKARDNARYYSEIVDNAYLFSPLYQLMEK
jgi:hypothetical protein